MSLFYSLWYTHNYSIHGVYKPTFTSLTIVFMGFINQQTSLSIVFIGVYKPANITNYSIHGLYKPTNITNYSIHGLYKPTNITNYSIHGLYKPTYNWGAPCRLYPTILDFSWLKSSDFMGDFHPMGVMRRDGR